ncbi:hypothetical protein D3C71_328500 [compost metagenome]
MASNQKVGALLKAPVTQAELRTQVATPTPVFDPVSTTGEVRRAIDASISGELTPLGVLARLALAKRGSTSAFVQLVEDVLERDINYAAARETVTESIDASLLIAEAASDGDVDRRITAEVQALLDSEPVQAAISHFCSFEDFGYAAGELVWNTSGSQWTIENIIALPPAWLTFDKTDARTPLLLPAEHAGTPQPLTQGKFVYVCRPSYGLPILRSHGYVGAFYKALKSMTLKDWAGFLEMCGQPLRVGYYDPKTIPDANDLRAVQKTLRRALENLGADAWAMLPEGTKIDFIESATKGASAAAFEDLVRYLDEQVTKRITGSVLATGTGNTGSGGSQALGNVHDDKFVRKLKSTASVVAKAIRQHIVAPYVAFNYGADTPVPFVRFAFEEPEDVVALTTALRDLVPLGLEVSQDEIREKLRLRTPAEGEARLAPSAQMVIPPDDGQGSGFSARRSRPAGVQAFAAGKSPSGSHETDEIDALIAEYTADDGYIRAAEDANSALMAAIEDASSVEELKAALLAAVKSVDVSGFQDALTGALLSSQAAGEFGARVGGK